MKASGTLIMAATSLGCPEDIPSRSLKVLASAELVVFEEDRFARQFLKAAGIHRDYLRFSEHRQQETLSEVRVCLKLGGKVVYMSDQGTPTLADPGKELLQVAYDLGAEVTVIPGPSSLTAAIAACPFSVEPFVFLGFLPRKSAERMNALSRYRSQSMALIILDTPYRRSALLKDCLQSLGAKRKALLALDISGPNEAFYFGTLGELEQKTHSHGEKLNFVLIIDSH